MNEDTRKKEILYQATLSFARLTKTRLKHVGSWQADIMQQQLDRLEQNLVTAYELGSKEQLLDCAKHLIRLAETIVSSKQVASSN